VEKGESVPTSGPSHVTIEATVATLRGSFGIPDPELLIEIGSTL
jgi:hypothetical protein